MVTPSAEQAQEKKTTRPRKQRGFVIVVVVAIAAVITAIVAAQLTSTQKLAASSLRMEEEVQARAIAQACLEMVSAQIDNFMFDCGAAPLPACATRPVDFDRILIGVDNIANNNDDFLPGIGNRVQIPRSATDRLHQWALLDLDGGACAMRIEDNSDDGRPGLPGMIDTAGEGTGTDIPNRDRDLAVYVHVIGMYPRLSTTLDADVYHKAHARTTLRRLIQKQNMASPSGPGLWAAVSIDIDDDNNICELGGVSAPDIDMEPSTCACGPISCATCSGTPPPGTSCSACTSGCTPSTNVGAPPNGPPVNVHWGNTATAATSFRSNEGLGPPLRADPLMGDVPPETPIGQGVTAAPTTSYDLSSAQFCGFYADNGPGLPLFVWDRLDPDAGASLQNWADNGVWDLVAPAQHPAVAAVSGGLPVDCRVHTADIPEPCLWTKGGTATTPATITSCPEAKSACWKLVAWMDESDSYAVGLNAAQVPLRGWTDGAGDTGFHPRRSIPIPNAARGPAGEARVFGAATAGQELLCGDTNPLRNCALCNSNALFIDTLGTDNNAFSVMDSHGDHWHFEGGSRDSFSPSPSVWVMEDRGSSDKDAHLKDVGSAGTGPFRATILVDGDADLESNAGICCATCDCTALTSLAMAGCALNSTFGDVPSPILTTIKNANPALFTDTAPPVEDNRTLGPAKGGIAIKARAEINVNNSALIIGDVRGETIDFNNNPCVVGSVVSYGTTSATECTSNCGSSHVCFDNAPKITGDVHSMTSIRFNNNPRIWGNIFAKRDVCFNDDARVEGLIQAGRSMELDQDSIIVNNVASTSGAATTALNQALVTFMEGAW